MDASSQLPVLGQATVMHDFIGEYHNELDLFVGNTVDILEQDESGWWRGRVEGQTRIGFFPSTFVQS